MTDLDQVWRDLESAQGLKGAYNRLRLDRGGCCPVYAACEKPENRKAIIIEVSASSLDSNLSPPATRGFDIQILPLSPGGNGTVALIVKLNEARFMDLFNVLVEDLLEHISGARTHREGILSLFTRLSRWQAFMEQNHPDGLGREAQLGLYGELWFLGNHLCPAVGPANAVASWKGPDKANQDFHLAEVAVEVKCSASNPMQKIAISNLRQLDDGGLETLLLLHLSLDARGDNGETLPEIVTWVRTLCGPDGSPSRQMLDDKLFAAGYLDSQASLYERTGYSERTHHFFHVMEGFPRIVERDVSPAIGDVRYSIALAACLPFAIDDSEAARHLSGKVTPHG